MRDGEFRQTAEGFQPVAGKVGLAGLTGAQDEVRRQQPDAVPAIDPCPRRFLERDAADQPFVATPIRARERHPLGPLFRRKHRMGENAPPDPAGVVEEPRRKGRDAPYQGGARQSREQRGRIVTVEAVARHPAGEIEAVRHVEETVAPAGGAKQQASFGVGAGEVAGQELAPLLTALEAEPAGENAAGSILARRLVEIDAIDRGRERAEIGAETLGDPEGGDVPDRIEQDWVDEQRRGSRPARKTIERRIREDRHRARLRPTPAPLRSNETAGRGTCRSCTGRHRSPPKGAARRAAAAEYGRAGRSLREHDLGRSSAGAPASSKTRTAIRVFAGIGREPPRLEPQRAPAVCRAPPS